MSNFDMSFLFKKVVKNFPRRSIVSYAKNDTWGVDLADYSKDPWPGYILVCIDYFTRKVHALNITKKTEEEITAGLLKIFSQSGQPKHIHSDRESGLVNNKMLKTRGIDVYHGNYHGSPICERAIRTLKEQIEIRRRSSKIQTWKTHVESVVHWYNAKDHSFLGMSPNVANSNLEDVQRIQKEHAEEKRPTISKKLELKAGDTVVTVKEKKKFEKGYTQAWNKDPIKVLEVLNTTPVMYRLANGKTYYHQQVMKINETQKEHLSGVTFLTLNDPTSKFS